ncbi:hypothetical protein OH76DRAFT_1477796 [Lentinus brumalis]|uniref:Uncharacterized protein n=1 Tax=Lentinus brumalis TaxID=2498619 RepID=A0A371DUA1_9APHY|nr:hypothetical protein OH76DRAFT_1477796 [Polyporus brumalis]
MPPSRRSRASSESIAIHGAAARKAAAEKVFVTTYRKDLLVLPREVSCTITLRDFFKLDAIARFVDPVVGIYSLGAVPPNATWGSGWRERLLCVENTEAAIWVIGCLEHVSYDIRARRPPSLSVKVHLLRECDRIRHASLNRRTSPKSRDHADTLDTFVATANIPDSQSVFRHLYDGSAGLDFQFNMGQLGINEIVPGDIVLLECSFVRTSPDAWATWSVDFELRLLTVVHRTARTLCGTKSRYRGGL